MVLTGIDGKTLERLKKTYPDFERWDVKFLTEPLERVSGGKKYEVSVRRC